MKLALILIAAITLVACGTKEEELVLPSPVDTTPFDGRYELIPEQSFKYLHKAVADATDTQSKQNNQWLLDHYIDYYTNFAISHGVIRSGSLLVQEFSLIEATLEGTTLHGSAMWHEDVYDPGDCAEVPISLTLTGNRLEFVLGDTAGEANDPVTLKRAQSVATPDKIR